MTLRRLRFGAFGTTVFFDFGGVDKFFDKFSSLVITFTDAAGVVLVLRVGDCELFV